MQPLIPHPPLPSQSPVLLQMVPSPAGHSFSGSVPAEMGAHVPLSCPVLTSTHASQRPPHCLSQQTPSMQNPLLQAPFCAAPSASTQTAPLSQGPHSGPPQSTSISPPSFLPLPQ